MEITYSVKDNNVSVKLVGKLDTAASLENQETFQKLEELASNHITIDCSQLSYLASSGLRQFLSLRHKSIEMNGTLTVTNLCDVVREVFEITNFYKIFDIR